ncbi:unnamed protein product [Fraxinus pennsylvanica]|uniref:Uncharacterized protein n=1 Tax=Fraxinus pennsylvanica TaxID=56036 RepID=A0AAD1ZFV2_9LAMI|nr:unnamed protein product [Fraxinus pennsylvanica]
MNRSYRNWAPPLPQPQFQNPKPNMNLVGMKPCPSVTFSKSTTQLGLGPRSKWRGKKVTTYYGGHTIKLVLHRFASNIIFSNGLRDPYSSGGMLEDISECVVAIYTINGSHCLDIRSAQPSDPEWLVTQRKKEIKIIIGWITEYYADLLSLKK